MKKVAIVGAESTGKSTLCVRLAKHYGIPCLPEYGRLYTLELADSAGSMESIVWTPDDFLKIADGQRKLEQAAAQSSSFHICDTDMLAVSIWQERYLGSRNLRIEALAATHPPDLYLLTACDVPFVSDEIRDGEDRREWMTARFRDVIEEKHLPLIEIGGSWQQRFDQAISAIDRLMVSA